MSATTASSRDDSTLRDDPSDLFNLLADAGLDGGLTRAQWEATLEHHRRFVGADRPAKAAKQARAKGKARAQAAPDGRLLAGDDD